MRIGIHLMQRYSGWFHSLQRCLHNHKREPRPKTIELLLVLTWLLWM